MGRLINKTSLKKFSVSEFFVFGFLFLLFHEFPRGLLPVFLNRFLGRLLNGCLRVLAEVVHVQPLHHGVHLVLHACHEVVVAGLHLLHHLLEPLVQVFHVLRLVRLLVVDQVHDVLLVIGLCLWFHAGPMVMLVGSVRFDEFLHGFDFAVSAVIHYLVTSRWEKFQSGEALNFEFRNFVGGGIHLGNDDGIVILECLSEFLPFWCQLFAVTTPWGIFNGSNFGKKSMVGYAPINLNPGMSFLVASIFAMTTSGFALNLLASRNHV